MLPLQPAVSHLQLGHVVGLTQLKDLTNFFVTMMEQVHLLVEVNVYVLKFLISLVVLLLCYGRSKATLA